MITTNPNIMHGEPCIERTRITVSAILHLLARGASDGQIVEAYAPQITPQDLADVRAWWSSPKGMRWALARLHGGATRTVIAMVQRLLAGESIESVASDYDLDGEPIDPEALRGDLGGIEVLLADRRERDELRAQLAAVDAAIERNARIKCAEWTDEDRAFVADFTSEAAGFLAEMLLARLDMEKAPNYAEVSTEDLGRLSVFLSGMQIDICFRRTGAPTPHELRVKAEKERDEALALAEERRVRLMLAGLEKAPDGWVVTHHGTAFNLTWDPDQHLSGFVMFVIDGEGVRTIAKLDEPRDYRRTFFKTAVNAWTHAQALRAHIAQYGELPKDPQ